MSNKDKMRLIAKYLVSAKICSNAGKGIRDRFIICKGEKRYIRWAYRGKHHQIEMAMRLIDSMPFQTQFTYYVKKAPDQNGKSSIIVLFSIKVEHIKTLMCFHIPINRASPYLQSRVGKGVVTKWVKGKDDAPIILSRYFDI